MRNREFRKWVNQLAKDYTIKAGLWSAGSIRREDKEMNFPEFPEGSFEPVKKFL